MLVSAKHKKLILNLREPDRVTTIIPSAKTLQYKGRTLVVVPHRLDEVRVLRNLGMDAPAPMSFYYDWPGLYEPYKHQRVTSEFLSTNPRAFCLNGMGCIAGDDKVRVSRKGRSYESTLRDLFAAYSKSDRQGWKARSLKGDVFGMHALVDVLYKGEKPTLRVTLEDGKTFRATPDHRIARPDGSWTEAGALRVGDALVTNGDVSVTCPECTLPRDVKEVSAWKAARTRCRACKHAAHSKAMAGESNPAFLGTPFIDSDGYVRVWAPDHHRADNSGRVYEHILVAEAAFGVKVTRDFHVHHKNEVKSDNRPDNLEVLSASEHHRGHRPYANLDGSKSCNGGIVVVVPKSSRVAKIEDGGVVDVYDLCMEAPHHNFVVNGVVVHNSGKTISVLWAFDYLRKAGLVKRMLVIGPLSTLERAWGDEIYKHFPHLSFAVLHGSRERRHKLLAEDFDIYIINHDGIKSEDTLELLATREGLDVIVPDEVAEFRNTTTDRWKCLNRLVNGDPKKGWKPKDWAWGLTGTPIPNSPTDAFAQIRIINPAKVGKYFGHFRDTVMKQVTKFKWAPREGALQLVRDAMTPAVRFAREDCIDLPPTVRVMRHAAMTAEQTRAFNEMLKKFKTEYEGGEITAVNAAVKLSKLLQICSGVAYGAAGEVVIPAKPRMDLVREIIEEAQAKVLVFVPFTAALHALAAELRKHYTVEVVYGEVPKGERDRIFRDFQQSPDPHVIVADARTMSHGLTLTAADTTIWYGPPPGPSVYMQANERTPRPGQKLQTLIAHIEGCAVERQVYDRLQSKQSTQGVLLDLLKGV